MPSQIIEDAVGLVADAQSLDVAMRLIGSVAVAIFAKGELSARPNAIKDIDVVAESRQRQSVQQFLAKRGWRIDEGLLLFSESREAYSSQVTTYTVDVFYDAIEGNHRIALCGRLAQSFPTISWTDLLLTKLQRRKLRAVDIWDAAALLSAYKHLNAPYFQRLLGADWGLFTTVTDNLRQLRCDRPELGDAIDYLMSAARSSRKTAGWRIRALVGRRLKWWQEVYDVRPHAGGGNLPGAFAETDSFRD